LVHLFSWYETVCGYAAYPGMQTIYISLALGGLLGQVYHLPPALVMFGGAFFVLAAQESGRLPAVFAVAHTISPII
jgi:hypothetical protein